MEINTRKIKCSSFSSEIEKPLDRNLRTFITAETEIYEVGTQDNNDGTYNELYKCKLVGSTIIQQTGVKEKYVGKSKRTPSQKLKQAIWCIEPDDSYYEMLIDKIVLNLEDVIQYLKDK